MPAKGEYPWGGLVREGKGIPDLGLVLGGDLVLGAVSSHNACSHPGPASLWLCVLAWCTLLLVGQLVLGSRKKEKLRGA